MSAMILDQRRQSILDLVEERGFASLQELVQALGASESTVRRDLESLHSEGRVRRTRGGAAAVSRGESVSFEPPGARHRLAQKQRIGAAAAALLNAGETVLIDGGSTTLEVARHLDGRPRQVVTNSLPILNLLFGRPGIDVVMLGGLLDSRSGVALGPLTTDALEHLHVRTLVLGCGGVTERGLDNQNSLLVDAERRMLDAADETILVADSTKFGHSELAHLCDLSRINRLVTDDGLDPEWQRRLEDVGIAVEIAT